MIITTEEAERLAIKYGGFWGLQDVAAALRSIAAERDTLKAELDQAVGCIEDAKAEREQLQTGNARLREAIEMAQDCLEDKDVIGASLTLTKALGEKDNGKA